MSFESAIDTLEKALLKAFPSSSYSVSYGAKIMEGNGTVNRVDQLTLEDFFDNLQNMPTETIFVTVEERAPRNGRPARRVLTKAFDLAHTPGEEIQKTVQRMHDSLDALNPDQSAQ